MNRYEISKPLDRHFCFPLLNSCSFVIAIGWVVLLGSKKSNGVLVEFWNDNIYFEGVFLFTWRWLIHVVQILLFIRNRLEDFLEALFTKVKEPRVVCLPWKTWYSKNIFWGQYGFIQGPSCGRQCVMPGRWHSQSVRGCGTIVQVFYHCQSFQKF